MLWSTAGLTECEIEGIAGNCGERCRVYQRGECEEVHWDDEVIETPESAYDRAMGIIE